MKRNRKREKAHVKEGEREREGRRTLKRNSTTEKTRVK